MGVNRPPDYQHEDVGTPVSDEPILRIGEFRIDLPARVLTKNNLRIAIQHKPLDVLIYLAENNSRFVSREELLARFWPRAVNEEALTRCISTIRKDLGDVEDPPATSRLYGARATVASRVSLQWRGVTNRTPDSRPRNPV